MDTKHKKGFTLVEMAIVLIILAMVIGTVVSMARMSFQKDKLFTTKQDVHKIKQSILGYAGIHHRLPYADTNTTIDGMEDNSTIGLGFLPYLTLQTVSKDKFGSHYMYDVNESLAASTTVEEFCSVLTQIRNSTTALPMVQNHEVIPQSYSVAAIIISKGEDKVLTGKNDEILLSDRIYEMETNRFDTTSNNDSVFEISATDLYNRVCTNTVTIAESNMTSPSATDLRLNFVVNSGNLSYEGSNIPCVPDTANGTHQDINATTEWMIFYEANSCDATEEKTVASNTYLQLIDANNDGNVTITVTAATEPVLSD